MAKQRGIHQISGTVNNLTYYEQKYVRGGLIRRVNEGMSNRLKSDPAFENTRKKNAIFGMCSKIAAAVWSQVPSASINSIRPSVHARTTRFLYQYFAQRNFVLGDTVEFDSQFTRSFIDFLNSQLRIKLTDFDPSIITYVDNLPSQGNYILTLQESTMIGLLNKIKGEYLGISGRRDVAVQAPVFDSSQQKYLSPDILEQARLPWVSFDQGDVDVVLDLPISYARSGFKFWCVQVFPMVQRGNTVVPIFNRSISLFIGYID